MASRKSENPPAGGEIAALSDRTPTTLSPLLLAILVSLAVCGLMASDINLPAVPRIAADFGVGESSVQRTFSIYMAGLVVAQALYGPVSDAYGRRPLVLAGFSLFAVASVLCATAPGITAFAVGRLLQALGAGTGLVVGRAMVGDLFDKRTATRTFATIMPIVGVSPAVSPLIGSYLTTWFSWRAPFVLTAVIGGVTVAAVALAVPETLSRRGGGSGLRGTVGNYPYLLRQSRFWLYAVSLAAGYSAYFGYLVASPVIFQRMGLSTTATGYCYISVSFTYVLGNLCSRRLSARRSISQVLGIGYLLFSTAALLLLVAGLAQVRSPWPLLVLMGVVATANGFLLPMSYAGGVTQFPSKAASASGLLGALQMIGGSVASLAVGFFPGDARALSVMIFAIALSAVAAFLSLSRFSARPGEASA
ncbi:MULTISPECIES: multidrug effflux MFS transporter [Streptomyces]|uniref:Multidrug effflux MFS transporter n=1 Tax=Streptomyces ramulosus TaxID=47762 RepID=A0ABW1FWY6_9ACTN